MSDFRDEYLKAVGLGEDAAKIDSALETAHELRKFEIELYWKRATYLWAFQAAAFAVLGLLIGEGNLVDLRILLLPGVFGFLTALAGWMTASGSKFWQDSWEAHVDLLEVGRGELSKVVLLSRSTRFSVSKVNQLLLFVLGVGWLSLVVVAAYPPLASWAAELSDIWVVHLVIALVAGLAALFFVGARSSLNGCIYAHGKWARFDSGEDSRIRRILKRDPPGSP